MAHTVVSIDLYLLYLNTSNWLFLESKNFQVANEKRVLCTMKESACNVLQEC